MLNQGASVGGRTGLTPARLCVVDKTVDNAVDSAPGHVATSLNRKGETIHSRPGMKKGRKMFRLPILRTQTME